VRSLGTPLEQAHRKTVEADVSEVARFLQETLGQKLVAHLAGVADPKLVGRWAKGKNAPRSGAEERLRVAYQVFQLLQSEESPHVVRAWLVGQNPQLEGDSPASAIREGRLKEVWVAAKAYISGG